MASISIIVPIYNSKRFLRQCLESIVSQKFSDFELICVDDSSTDSSRQIIFEFAEKDNRIRVVSHNERMGAAKARNHGFMYANAEYVVFWDADEIYASDLLLQQYETAIKYDADIVLAERCTMKQGMECITYEASKKNQFGGYDKKAFQLTDLPYRGLLMWSSSPINRLIKKSLITENNLEYQDLRSSNDVLFADMTMILAKKIIHIEDWEPKIYIRRNVPGSISINRDPFCSYKAFCEIKKQLCDRDIWDKYKKYIWYQFASTVSSELVRCNVEEIRKDYYDFIKREGLIELCGKEGIEFALFNTHVGQFISDLLEQPFETRTWEKSVFLRNLNSNKEKLSAMIDFFNKKELNVTLWGAGKWGKELMTFMQDAYRYKFDYVVDKNTDLHGKEIAGNLIWSFGEIKENTDLIVITNELYKEDIKKQIEQERADLKILVLPKYLGENLLQSIE